MVFWATPREILIRIRMALQVFIAFPRVEVTHKTGGAVWTGIVVGIPVNRVHRSTPVVPLPLPLLGQGRAGRCTSDGARGVDVKLPLWHRSDHNVATDNGTSECRQASKQEEDCVQEDSYSPSVLRRNQERRVDKRCFAILPGQTASTRLLAL